MSQDRVTADWQLKARPFMITMIVVLAAFFFVASLVQLIYLNWHIAHPPTLAAGELLNPAVCAQATNAPAMPISDCMALQERRALILLEENVTSRRYHQSNAIVMFSVWSRYLGFVTGMILAFVGSAFILGKMSEPATSVSTEGAGLKAAMSSTSPGLVMSFLGVVLMVASITTLHSLNTKDGATYLIWGAPSAGEAPSPSGVTLKNTNSPE